jgi:hypothetical protein
MESTDFIVNPNNSAELAQIFSCCKDKIEKNVKIACYKIGCFVALSDTASTLYYGEYKALAPSNAAASTLWALRFCRNPPAGQLAS